jgi:uncharacterized membrane protein
MNPNAWFLSSTGSGDLSLTIKGLLLALVPLSITVFQHYGVKIAENQVVDLINAVVAAVSALTIVVGMVRKFVNRTIV